ncbi:hypothetical protein [Pantoea ananatis]|uniref:hypothetical protein n=1 Tax=Pantoea ananas TaxID=553 RepID=UPI001B30A014|nr:hypothetical protein [Pantoea ananatis]
MTDWKWNALFRGDQETASYNACVGNNGAPDIYYYADGYADSVDLLIEGLTKGRGTLDTLIYPVCFNLRHAVELKIKGQIQDLSRLSKVRKYPIAPDIEIEKVLNQHDIKNLWAFLSENAIATDRRYREIFTASDALIGCIAETDPTGQTFRYSYSTEARKHLTDVSLINVLVLREQFRQLWMNLEKLSGLTDWLSQEYRSGTFTKNLSREDLMAIARLLPLRSRWSDASEGLDAIRLSVKSVYSIGSAELTEAIDKIQACRDMARLIGIPVSLPGVSLGDLVALNDFWKLAWNRDALENELRDDIFGREEVRMQPVVMSQAIRREIQAKMDFAASIKNFRRWATVERLAGLQALMEIGSYDLCEEHDRRYAFHVKEMESLFSQSSQSCHETADEIWSSTVGRAAYPSRVIDRLRRAGFHDEASSLAENLFS